MKKVFFVSTREYSGVSAVVIGTILVLKDMGKRVGYMKTIGYLPIYKDGIWTDIDSSFVLSLLGGDISLASCPIVLNQETYENWLNSKAISFKNILEEAYLRLSKDKDVFICEGGFNIYQGRSLEISAFEISKAFDFPIVLIERYACMELSDRVLLLKELLGGRLKGVILNMVKPEDMERAKKEAEILNKNGISIFGIIPFVDILQSTSIKVLADELGAKVLCGEEHLNTLVQSVMVGAMDPEHAIIFFQRKKDLVVITGGDRPDIQLAALEAKASCLILTGGFLPSDMILGLANQRNVPVLLVNSDTFTTAQKAEWLIGHSRTHEEQKLSILKTLIKEHVRLEAL